MFHIDAFDITNIKQIILGHHPSSELLFISYEEDNDISYRVEFKLNTKQIVLRKYIGTDSSVIWKFE